MTVTSAAGKTSGKTKITVTPAIGENHSYKYKVAANPTIPAVNEKCTTGYTAWNGTDEITATSGQKIVIVEVDTGSYAAAVGLATVVSAE